MASKEISLVEDTSKVKGECKSCRKESRCFGWWKKDVEEKGAVCVMKTDPEYLPVNYFRKANFADDLALDD